MPPVYTYDHMHLRIINAQATIAYYQQMFDATPVAYGQSNGQPRGGLDLAVPVDATLPTAPVEPESGCSIWGCASMMWIRSRPSSSAVAPRCSWRPRPFGRGCVSRASRDQDHVRIEILERTVIEVSEATGR